MLFHRACLPLSRRTLSYPAGVLRRHRRAIASRRRALSCARQVLPVLVHLRAGQPYAQVGAGFGVSTSTAWRYVHEAVEFLAARAPKLERALRAARTHGEQVLVLDGTLIPIDRLAADRPFYSGTIAIGRTCKSSPRWKAHRCGCQEHCPAVSMT